ncbi:MAG: hypothetical protein ACAH59_04685, partial [Pseudobdellovibrionaceae bacterium]
IQHNWMENLGFQIGKFGTDIGGIEGMTNSADLYLKSQAYGGGTLTTTNALGTVSYLETENYRYATGLKAMSKFAGNEISLMLLNQETPAVDGAGKFYQSRNGYGLVWKGEFLDQTLKPVLSWHQDNLQTQANVPAVTMANTSDKKYDYYAAGLKYDWEPFFIELDYLYNTYLNRSTVDEADKTSSVVGTLGGRMENWVARLKVESSETEIFTGTGSSTKPKLMGYQAALEYLPTGDKSYRYHLAYVQKDQMPDLSGAGSDTQTVQQVFAGVRLFADFLK